MWGLRRGQDGEGEDRRDKTGLGELLEKHMQNKGITVPKGCSHYVLINLSVHPKVSTGGWRTEMGHKVSVLDAREAQRMLAWAG